MHHLCHVRRRVALVFLICVSAAAQSALAIRGFTFRQYDGGPAWGAGQAAHSGETVVFTFEAAGLATGETEDEKKVSYEWEAIALDAKDVLLAAPMRGKAEVVIQPEDKKWVPKLTGTFQLPDFLASGEYRVSVTLRDLTAKSSTTGVFPFRLEGPSLIQTSELAIQRSRFLRSEEDARPLDSPAFSPGETFWVRFEITGFTPSKDGEVGIRYGLKVASSTGKTVFEQPVAAEERKKYFYSPSYLPGIVSLTLDQKVARGAYTLILVVEDLVKNTSSESAHPFRVE